MDTNTLVSAFLRPNSLPGQALDQALQEIVLVSDATLAELETVLRRDKFDPYLPLEERLTLLDRFQGVGFPVHISETIAACRDPKDDKFLELAVNGKADAIVTGDKDLLALHPFRGIAIMQARGYLELYPPHSS